LPGVAGQVEAKGEDPTASRMAVSIALTTETMATLPAK